MVYSLGYHDLRETVLHNFQKEKNVSVNRILQFEIKNLGQIYRTSVFTKYAYIFIFCAIDLTQDDHTSNPMDGYYPCISISDPTLEE